MEELFKQSCFYSKTFEPYCADCSDYVAKEYSAIICERFFVFIFILECFSLLFMEYLDEQFRRGIESFYTVTLTASIVGHSNSASATVSVYVSVGNIHSIVTGGLYR
eukprot:gene25194-27246_t